MKRKYFTHEERLAARRRRRNPPGVVSKKERFIERIPETGCWIWLGKLNSGYGIVRQRINGKSKSEMAHRYLYKLYGGELPDDLDLCHRCDVPCCVNPEHMFVGTHTDNMRDMYAKGRNANFKGENNPNYRHGKYTRDRDL